jgi:hypothetical protein
MIHGAGAEQFAGVAEQRIERSSYDTPGCFIDQGCAIFACLPARRHRCQTDLVFSLQGEEVFPSPVSPM